jgi:hypothetical protein
LGIYQKVLNNSKNVFNVGKFFTGIIAEIDESSGGMCLVA